MTLRYSQIVTSYNQRSELHHAIRSVVQQEPPPHEVIVGDDGSTDGSQDIIREFESANRGLVRGVLSSRNRGIAANLNRCVTASTGDWISILAGDDQVLPGRNARQFECIESTDLQERIVYSDYFKQYSGRKRRVLQSNEGAEGDVFSKLARRSFYMRNFWIERSLVEEIGGYDESLPMYEDWKLKLEATQRAQVKYCPGVYSVYNISQTGIHRLPISQHLLCIEKIYRDICRAYRLTQSEMRALTGSLYFYRMRASDNLFDRLRWLCRALQSDFARWFPSTWKEVKVAVEEMILSPGKVEQ